MIHNRVLDILDKALQGITLDGDEIKYLFTLHDAGSIERVMAAARRMRERYFGRRIFMYGFVYLSTYCRNHCSFCFYRKPNRVSPRYRKSGEEVLEIASRLADSGIHLVDLTLGEDPRIHDTGRFDGLLEMISQIKHRTSVPVMISPGIVPDEVLTGFAQAGADWYALYQETHNPRHFSKLRIGQDYYRRARKRTVAREAGMLVEDGVLLGAGETTWDRVDSILDMQKNDLHQVRAMSFVPQAQTPLAGLAGPERLTEYLFIAVMRLVMPRRLIPASLDVDGIKGLAMRLDAGANVVTSIIPPHSRLAGVSQSTMDIDEGLRTVPEVKKILAAMDLEAASLDEYQSWMAAGKKANRDAEGVSEARHARRAHAPRLAAG